MWGMAYVIGVDTGGTFTDTVIVADDGSRVTGKAEMTPDDPSADRGEGEISRRLLNLLQVLHMCLFSHISARALVATGR